jgi:ribose transport system substrate-binding protein
MHTRATRAVIWLIALSAVAAFAAGCGSDDKSDSSSSTSTSSSGGSAAAQKIVAEQSKPIAAWSGFQAPIKPATGKKIVAIECSALGVGCVQMAEGVKEAGSKLGWTTDIVNGKGDPTVWNSAIQSAVSDKADGIVLTAISPALVKEGIAKAKAAGVPVIAGAVGPPADALVAESYPQGATAMASYIATAANGGKTLVLNDSEFVSTVERYKLMYAELKKLCPDCKTSESEFTFATSAEKLPGQVASALQSDPKITNVVVPYDAAVPFVRQGIQQASSKAQVASFEGDPGVMKTVGDGVQAADVASNNTWIGWQSVDDLARLISDKPVKDVPLPVRLFTKENAADAKSWDGDLDYRSKYLEIWGK